MTDTAPLLGERYQRLELIGEGGSAFVYRAFDTRVGRDVALKILHDYVIPADRKRFEREIRTLARISHPGVISIYDLGNDEEGKLYFTMQLLDGGAFSTLGPMEDSPELLERFFRASFEVLDTLGHLHSVGMIHRDLTPQNILLGKEGRPRVMDFGLVYLSEGTRDLTRSGYTLGTPHYMAPEQAKGLEIGPFSDLYAFGAVMYRTLTGSVMFDADNDQSVLFQHVYEEPILPLERNPILPEVLSSGVMKFLEKRPADRPGSGIEARNLLGGVQKQVWSEHVSGQYRGGRARAGVHPRGVADPSNLEQIWELNTGAEVAWPAALTAGREGLTLGSREGSLRLMDYLGQVRQTFKVADEVTAPALLEGSTVTFGAWDGHLHHFDLSNGLNGQELWRFRTRAEITASPTRWKNQLWIPSRDGSLYALEGQTGELLWSYKAAGPLSASPLVWSCTALIADEQGWLHGLDARTGKSLWKLQLGAVHATPALSPRAGGGAVLLVPCWGGELHALALEKRGGYLYPAHDALLWSYDLEGELWASPTVYQGRVYVVSWTGKIHALTLEEGDDLWERNIGGRLTASPIYSEGILYLGNEENQLLALRADQGAVLWQKRFPVGIQATPLIREETLYAAFMDGTVRAFR